MRGLSGAPGRVVFPGRQRSVAMGAGSEDFEQVASQSEVGSLAGLDLDPVTPGRQPTALDLNADPVAVSRDYCVWQFQFFASIH